MVEQTANDTAGAFQDAEDRATPRQEAAAKRIYSEVEFPYIDLKQAILLVQTMHTRGGGSCQDKELAAWLNQSPDGGTYKARRTAARMFGLVEVQGGLLTLTELGRDAVGDDATARLAIAESFLKPELYSILYEAFGGHALPPPPAIERRIEQAGVSPKQKERARQAFQKSAVFAGYIDQSTGRFVKPGNAGTRSPDHSQDREQESNKGGGGGGGSGGGGDQPGVDPIIQGLLVRLPKAGDVWPEDERKLWLNLLEGSFKLIYKPGGNDPTGSPTN